MNRKEGLARISFDSFILAACGFDACFSCWRSIGWNSRRLSIVYTVVVSSLEDSVLVFAPVSIPDFVDRSICST